MIQRMKELGDENGRLKKRYAEERGGFQPSCPNDRI